MKPMKRLGELPPIKAARSSVVMRRARESKFFRRIRDMTPFRERNPITVGLVVVAVLGVLMLFAFSLGRFPFLRGVYSIQADFLDAAGLTPENEVRIAGLKVGKVTSIELVSPNSNDVFDRVRVKLELASGIHIGTASEAEIKLKTILGSKFIDIAPKGTKRLEPGETISLDHTRIPFELYEVTNRVVEEVGDIDAKVLNDALRELGDLTEDPEGNLGRALQGLAKASEGLKDRNGDLQEIVSAGSRILEVLGDRSQELGRILDSGGKLLGALAERRDALSTLVDGSNRLSAQLSDLLRDNRSDLDPALRDLHVVLEVLRKDIGPLERAVKTLGPSAKSFGRPFTQGKWGDIWLQTVLDLPLPPIIPGGTAMSSSSSVSSIFTGAMQ